MAVTAPDLVHFSFPVIKSAPDSSGDLRVYGCVTNDTLDRDLERIDPVASRRWLETWMATGGNVRMAHDPRRPVGKGVALDFKREGHYLTSIVVDPLAAEMVRKGVLTCYSVGVSRPGFRADPTGKALRVITDSADGTTELAEVSLVDRGSNPDSGITILPKVARTVDQFIAKAAGRADSDRERAVRALLRADLDSPDPETRLNAQRILGVFA
jgi:hypothetical protein